MSSGMYRPHQTSLPVPLSRGRPQFTANHLGRELYALYASKSSLCALCKHATPELTAYNAYRNANRRVRRAERLKMYAVGDAYKVHTECIQAYKRGKEREFLSLLLLYTVCLLSSTVRVYRQSNSSLPASSGIHGPHHASLLVYSNQGRRRAWPAKKKAPR